MDANAKSPQSTVTRKFVCMCVCGWVCLAALVTLRFNIVKPLHFQELVSFLSSKAFQKCIMCFHSALSIMEEMGGGSTEWAI